MRKLNNSNVFFSSDFHYSHRNICRGVSRWEFDNENEFIESTRDFPDLNTMNETLVHNINSTVGKGDTLIFLGDWSFGGFDRAKEFSSLIDCENIIFILGNHDHHIEENKDSIQDRFISVSNYEHILVEDGLSKNEFVMSHYPLASWNNIRNGALHLHGHLHRKGEKIYGPGKMMDAGIDGHPEFRPYHISEIIQLLETRPKLSLYNDLG